LSPIKELSLFRGDGDVVPDCRPGEIGPSTGEREKEGEAGAHEPCRGVDGGVEDMVEERLIPSLSQESFGSTSSCKNEEKDDSSESFASATERAALT